MDGSTYGGQKKRHYIRFMSIAHPDTYIVHIIGPFQGSLYDANITKEIRETNNSLNEWLRGNGQIIVDRGSRDVTELFQNLGYDTTMPAFKKSTSTIQDYVPNQDVQLTFFTVG
jgi:hypothetical protein